MSAAFDTWPAALGALVLSFALAAGCASQRTVAFEAANPAVSVTSCGVYFAGDKIAPGELPGILEDMGIPKTRTIHIQLDAKVKDLREARLLMGMLGKAGYTRPVLVTKRHAESMAVGRKKPQ